ncbi:MAG TPA: FAD-dependent monooxygenase [Amycolatopsis sp.]|nr:FAD-dependent monooxygenase [Amycolatopsis sp.]
MGHLADGREEFQTSVTVIGAGPAGLVTSLLLSKYGVAHVLVEKYPTMAHTPRAHIVNQRTVEIFRDLGLEQEFLDVAMPWDMMANTVWHTSLSGLELARRQSWGNAPERRADYLKASPCGMANCGQHLLEPLLLEHALKSEHAEVLLNHVADGIAEDGDGVVATVTDRESGRSRRIRSRYLVGADGGRSLVAEAIGLAYEGEEGISASATVHFHADLSRYTSYRPGTLYWNASPGSENFRGLGNLICHRPWHDWALAYSYDPDREDETHPDQALRRLRKIIGDDSIDIDIRNISTWTINHLVASSYARGRVFCMGDAVHRHPPTNGLGLNTSVADAYNLAWKLALVVNGVAGERLLDTYSVERQPVGRQVVDRAFASIGDMRPINEALGFRNGQSEAEGRAALRTLYGPGPQGRARRQALAKAVAATDYQFNAHGVEVGYRYRAGAVVPDGTPEPRSDRDPELFYQPTTWPGAHLPHAWLDRGEGRVSTYDVAGQGRFTLFTGIGGDAWLEAAAASASRLGIELAVVRIGTPDGYRDCYGDWSALSEVDESGCVLVRPDLFVAWRSRTASAEAVAELPGVLARLLARETSFASKIDR